ncbi:SAM-dependent methyltransferase [Pseudoclavibacter sp. RFBJ3]|uniref:DNA methyltransferase n=1 Tax=unclassified Pseudoclavibacter TaxID=2615177 RepID=UPI000CE73CC8|nr:MULTISPECIES: DNA methyltransferase [unclassified Pseudoclavibacter]PPF80909.1 SAM-dependent methyltransferase [Pseudoclavibacter sp. RFBJ5]PPF94418.1 SAM-dependent methyltransferase [Pseudoclavibacter sp. RFBJ3]PPF99525.1 SAM-dependent methyltransferase [Pseudoclavibacter sp. RFBH5]PPG25720.1 SAM-dependent methyltransferase [Pseudoclavibacter sp. RFBI4]
MAKLSLKAVEERVAPLAGRENYDREFIFDLLLAYGKPQGNVTRLRNGSLNVALDQATEVAQKNVVYFKDTTDDALAVIEDLKTAPAVVRFSTRFVIVTDYVDLIAHDTKTNETIGFPIREIDEHFTFFLPWAGMEKAQYAAESHADVKAAERMGKLFDELLQANPGIFDDERGRHSLNIFFTRLLFCFFAEDTGIFTDNQFTNAIGSQTHADGSDLAEFLTDLFEALDTANPVDKPKHLAEFPYVNGRLFTVNADQLVPRFTKQAREELIAAGRLIWRDINPDIFGSMFQAIVTPGKRSDLGQHYTSVPNILKTIEPLFLDDLKAEINAAQDSERRLVRLLDRIAAIKVFDPACGSGNFLVIGYKELRKLEHAILERLAELSPSHQVLWADSKISIENFYGIEIDDFAVEVAILSLWIVKHQMNREFREKFRVEIPLIPLKETGQIRPGNATRMDWNTVCANDGSSEIYLIGNPPYVGAKVQTKKQKADFDHVFEHRIYSKNLDYIALWFVKGADYIEGTRAELAFVTTNSVAQGEHVGLMFPMIFEKGVEIGFAYTSFKWENNAKRNAGVTVAVIGLRRASSKPKYIYTDDLQISAENINGYLADGAMVSIERRRTPLGTRPEMVFGSMPRDGGGLILSPLERAELLAVAPEAESFVKRYVGSSEVINDGERYCLWITDDEAAIAREIPPVAGRLRLVAEERSDSKAASTAAFAVQPHRFVQISYKPTNSIIVPRVSSERREYMPMGYLGADTVISDAAFAVYDAEPWLFAILTSRLHMVWTRAVGGKLKTDFRYSSTIVYNNFPVPPLSETVKEKLALSALRVLDVREYHCEQTLAELYAPDKMPQDLRDAHAKIDALVDSIYSKKPYETDEQRLSDLFALHERMTAEEAVKAPANKPRRTVK